MFDKHIVDNLSDSCDIYFEKSLISKEQIIRSYIDFISSAFAKKNHSVSAAFHTGSICFDVVLYLVSALACISLDTTDANSIVESLNEGDMIIYKNERYIWLGLEEYYGRKCFKIEKNQQGKNGSTTVWVPFEINKNLIKPYYGLSNTTDGRGIRRKKNTRAEFLTHVLGICKESIPSVTGLSTVVVTDRHSFDRISKGIRITYENQKSIELLDLITASYFTDSGEEYQYGHNPAKTEAVLKVTGSISTARKLVLDKRTNDTVGLLVLGNKCLNRDKSELIDLIDRNSLKCVHLATGIDLEYTKEIIEMHDNLEVFACTKKYLIEKITPIAEQNKLTLEIRKQMDNIINYSVNIDPVQGGCDPMDYNRVKELLSEMRMVDWRDNAKDEFIINAYSLLNLFTTSVFSIKKLEDSIENNKLMVALSSPMQRIKRLREIAHVAETVFNKSNYIVDVLERLYWDIYHNCPKYINLKNQVVLSKGSNIAIVVPKAYYINLLSEEKEFNRNEVTIINSNRFSNSVLYDEIITVGDLSGSMFNPFNCRAASKNTVLLYECENHSFNFKRDRSKRIEKMINSRMDRVNNDDVKDESIAENGFKQEEQKIFADNYLGLEEYIEKIARNNLNQYISNVTNYGENTPTSEVFAAGCFVSGEQILFSKYYKAVVFNHENKSISEMNIESLSPGDQLIFIKRDDNTRNMVDYIYDNLRLLGHFNYEIIEATQLANSWKEILREYKNQHNLSYKDIALKLQELGSSLQEISIRQWLVEDSHIVGPRDKATLQQIAVLTNDVHLLNNTDSYYEACRVVRRQRKEILELIGRAITDKLSGKKTPSIGLIQAIYDNVENLSDTLELESIILVDEPLIVPVNMMNKPILNWEVML